LDAVAEASSLTQLSFYQIMGHDTTSLELCVVLCLCAFVPLFVDLLDRFFYADWNRPNMYQFHHIIRVVIGSVLLFLRPKSKCRDAFWFLVVLFVIVDVAHWIVSLDWRQTQMFFTPVNHYYHHTSEEKTRLTGFPLRLCNIAVLQLRITQLFGLEISYGSQRQVVSNGLHHILQSQCNLSGRINGEPRISTENARLSSFIQIFNVDNGLVHFFSQNGSSDAVPLAPSPSSHPFSSNDTNMPRLPTSDVTTPLQRYPSAVKVRGFPPSPKDRSVV
jgi:hypothetical protein